MTTAAVWIFVKICAVHLEEPSRLLYRDRIKQIADRNLNPLRVGAASLRTSRRMSALRFCSSFTTTAPPLPVPPITRILIVLPSFSRQTVSSLPCAAVDFDTSPKPEDARDGCKGPSQVKRLVARTNRPNLRRWTDFLWSDSNPSPKFHGHEIFSGPYAQASGTARHRSFPEPDREASG
jgi:hypothetical protein